MSLDYTPYGITPLKPTLPETTDGLKRGPDWRDALARETSPLVMTPAERKMMLTLLPMLKRMYIDTLRRTVLGEDTMRVALHRESLLQRATQDDIHEHGLPYQKPLELQPGDVERFAPTPKPAPAADGPPQLVIPSAEDIEEFTAKGHTRYARERALHKDNAGLLKEHLGHINDRVKRFAIMLYEDTDEAERMMAESSDIAREAAQLLTPYYDGPNAALFAAEDVTHKVEHMLEKALTDALLDLPQDSAVIDRYLESAKAIISQHIDSAPGIWR